MRKSELYSPKTLRESWGEYVTALRHALRWLIFSVALYAIGIYGAATGKNLKVPAWGWLVLASVAFVVSQFLAFHQMRSERDEMRAERDAATKERDEAKAQPPTISGLNAAGASNFTVQNSLMTAFASIPRSGVVSGVDLLSLVEYTPSPVVRNRDFDGQDIVGPAVVMFMDGVVFDGSATFMTPGPEETVYPVGDRRELPGVIGIANTRFRDCRFFQIGIVEVGDDRVLTERPDEDVTP